MEQEFARQVRSVEERLQKMVEERVQAVQEAAKEVEAPSSWAEVVGKAVDSRLCEIKDDVLKVKDDVAETMTRVEQQRDREQRVNNIVMYNIEENRTDDKEQWFRNEHNLCMELFNNILQVGLNDNDIVKKIRLGPRSAGTKRPMLVQFQNRGIKNLVMENLRKLRNAPDSYRNVIIGHDLTCAEREEVKKLVKLAGDMENGEGQGEWMYRVRGSPGNHAIVKLRKKVQAL